uniref:Uncharacterized protein n=1 Tax=Biomphalaria glabrata TaxID=6526 RepID=A0A2C9L7T0_BIOGL
MAATKREELLASVQNKNSTSTGFVKLIKQLSHEETLTDTLVELNKRQLEDLWDGSLRICMSTLMGSDSETYYADHVNEICELLHSIIALANATINSMLAAHGDKNDQAIIMVPQSLTETAILIHGIFPTLTIDQKDLKDHISQLFESWWINTIAGREELMGNTIFYLLTKSIQPKSTQADVNRVKAVQNVLSAIDLNSESAGALCPLLLQCTYHHQYVTTPAGVNFLSYLFTLDVNLMNKIHLSIRNHLLSVPKAWHTQYGEIYFKAWQKCSGDIRENFEQNCIQDIMFRAVHATRGQRSQVFNSLFKILSYIHKEKTQRGVDAMLTKLYEPILWRSLMVANSYVRANAATLMFDVFPLYDPFLHNEQIDSMLQKQFDLMQSLMSDPVPEVRLITVKGVGHVLSIFWELIPSQVIQFFVTSLVQEQIYDISSPAVREAVLKVMNQLCDNHLSIPMLKTVLPELSNFVHDNSEKVRIAMLDVLLKVKGLRAIKYYHVVPVEHILARLEIDTAPVCDRIMNLIYHSFVSTEQHPAEQVKRCIALIKTNRGAARQFFTYLPKFLSLEDTIKYIIMLCRYMLHLLELIAPNLSNASDGSINESENSLQEVGHSKKDKKAAPLKRTRKQRKKDSGNGGESSAHTEEELNQNEDDSENSESLTNMCGMVEAIYFMLTTIIDKLGHPDNKPMKEGLLKKLSITVRKLMAVSQGTEMDSALIALAGHLPGKALPLIGQNLFNRLKQVCRQKEASDITVIVKALVMWGRAESIIELVKDSLGKKLSKLSSPEPTRDPKGITKPKKKRVGFTAAEEDDINIESALNIVVRMVTLAECRVVLLTKHKKGLESLLNTMEPVLQLIRNFLNNDQDQAAQKSDVNLWIKTFGVYTRLAVFICLPNKHGKVDDSNTVSSLTEPIVTLGNILNWTALAVIPFVKSDNKEKQEASTGITVLALKVCYGLVMVNIYNEAILDNQIHICRTVLESHSACTQLSFQALVCLLQLVQIRKPKSELSSGSEVFKAFENNIFTSLKSFLNAYISGLGDSEVVGENVMEDKPGYLTELSPVLVEIVHELTKPGKSLQLAERTLNSVLLCSIEEIKNHCQKKGLLKGKTLSPLASIFLNFIVKRDLLRRLFLQQLEKYLDLTIITDIYLLCSLVSIITWLKSVSADSTEALTKSISKLVAEATDNQVEETVFRDLKKQLEERVQEIIPQAEAV